MLVAGLAALSLALPGAAIASTSSRSEPPPDPVTTEGHDHGDHDHSVGVDGVPENDHALGLVYDGLVAATSGPCAGMFEVEGQPGACTHGPDLPPDGLDGTASVEPVTTAEANMAASASATAAAVCEGDGVNGKRTEVLYVRETGSPDRYDEYLASFRTWVAGVDSIFEDSAAKTGGSRLVRWVTDSACDVVVHNLEVPNGSLGSFPSSVDAIASAGYDRGDRKYLMFADTNALCGVAYVTNDATPGPENRSNGGRPGYGRVDNRCWNADVAAHELVHMLGAVLPTSPNAGSRGGHCMDDYDLLCYNDGSGEPRIVCADRRNERLLDCNNDDYFHLSPPAGSFLSQNWNIADSGFLVAGGGGTPPDPEPEPPTPEPDPDPDPEPPPPDPDPDPDPEPPPPPDGVRTITGLTGKCLDVWRADTADNTPVQLYRCNGTAAQTWTFDGAGRLQALGKCLDVERGRNDQGTKTVLWRCDDSGTQEFEQRGDAIVHVPSGRCLDVPNGRAEDWTQLIIWDCHGGENQRWQVS